MIIKAENTDLFGFGLDRNTTLFGLTHSIPDFRHSTNIEY